MQNEQPRRLPWRDFEDEVALHIEASVRRKELCFDKDKCQIVKRDKLFSKDRNDYIVFDVVVKLFSAMSASVPIIIWIWECKNLLTREVSVDDVEEFHSKLKQVGAHKGTIATCVGFQAGALAFAKTHKIGLLTLDKQESNYLALSADPRSGEEYFDVVCDYCLFSSGREISGPSLSTIVGHEVDMLPGLPD